MNQNPTVEELFQRITALEETLDGCRKEKDTLKKSLDRYHSIVKNTSEAIVVIQHEKIKLANAVAVNMSGFSLDGQPGAARPFLEWVHPDDREAVVQNYAKRIQGEKVPSQYDVRLLDKEKNYRWISVRPVAITWEGEPASLVFMSDVSKRRQIEEELKQSERNYREIFNNTNEAIFIHHIETWDILDVNKAMCDMFGYSKEEAVKLTVDDISQGEPPYSHTEINQWMEKAVSEGPQLFEWMARRKDGEYFWAEVNLKKAQIGSKIYVLAVVRDVSTRKMAEESLLESEEKYRLLVENASQGIMIIQGNRIVYANPRIKQFFPSIESKVFPDDFIDILDPEYMDAAIRRFQRISQQKETPSLENEYSIIEVGGNRRWVQTYSTHISYGGEPAIMTFLADISERKKAETELKENEERYRQAIENSPNPIFSVDGAGAIKMWNRACETVFKYEKDIINQHYQKLLSESEDPDAVQAMISNVFQGHSMSDIDLLFKCKDGKERFMVSRLYPMYDNEKQVQGCVFGNTDITERKLAEEALRDSEYRYRMLAQNLPGIVYRIMLREDNHIIFFNDLLQSLTGYKAEELQFGKDCGMEPFILTEDRERVVGIVQSAVEEESAFEVDYRFMHKNGSVKWFNERGKTIYGDDGKPLYIDGLIFDVTKRKQAEEALGDSKAQKQAILDASVDAIMQLDKDMRIIWANKKAAEMVYEVPKNLVGKTCHKIYYDLEEPCKGCFGVQAFQTGDIEMGTISHKGMDGVEEYYWEHFAVPLKGENGHVQSIIEISRNVTDKVKSENMLKASEERFRQLSEATWEAIGIHDHGILLRANQQFYDMFGYEPEELLNTDVFPTIATPESVKHIQSQIDSGRLDPYEVIGCKKDGTEFPMIIRVKVMEYYGKNVRVVAIRDISERKKAEKKILESEKKYRSVFENIQDVYFEVDREGIVQEISPSVEKYTSYNREELIGESIYNFIKNAEEGKTLVNKIMKEGRIGEFEFELTDKDGTGLHVSMNMMVVKNEKEDVVKIVGTMRDVTERKIAEKEKNELEERLIRSQKMEALGFLAGGVAHDLNNVLSGIVSYPDLLLMDLSEDNPLRGPILTIQESGQKASMIVQDLLTLARRGVTATETLDLNKIVSDYFRSPEHQKIVYPHNRINIQIDLKADLPHLKGSDVHLKKTIMNLVSNAVEAMPEGGEIIVSTENKYVDRPISGYDHVEEGDYIVLTIKDSGIGISSEDLKRIFEPFYTKKVMGRSGTGLGMAVVWGAVQDHKGYIDVQRLEGKGSTFELYFPITREVIDTEKAVTPIEDYKGGGESILVVDDVREQREIASSILTKLNYSVNTVSSGEEAVEFLRNESADLILLDMIMDNGIDGLETYKRILQFCSGQKAIVVSGFSETDRVKEAQKLGAGEYIKKPYTMETIGIAIREELDK